jgi:hypothetical protein
MREKRLAEACCSLLDERVVDSQLIPSKDVDYQRYSSSNMEETVPARIVDNAS